MSRSEQCDVSGPLSRISLYAYISLALVFKKPLRDPFPAIRLILRVILEFLIILSA
jgi:hypothetical protein